MPDDHAPPALDSRVANQVASMLGSSLRSASPTAWGFKNETWDVFLDDDQRIIVQIFRHREDATHRLRTMRLLGRRTDLPIPQVLAESLNTGRMWAAYVRLEGEPGYERASSDLSDEAWPIMAREMGSVVRSLRAVPTAGADLPDLWAHPDALTEAAYQWAAHSIPHYNSATDVAVSRLIDSASKSLGSFTPVVCHGDFGPQNVLFTGTTSQGSSTSRTRVSDTRS
ncbi:phosphotransferase family protein [Microbacterium sp. P02]|uniref:phosphotransferase family protein n=1 Tax=Microbacterium sp. P02 TaxID=3366260 RepID=UPI00366F3264